MKTLSHPLAVKLGFIAAALIGLIFLGCDRNNHSEKETSIVQSKTLVEANLDSTYRNASKLSTKNPEEAMKIAKQILVESKKTDYQKGMANAYNLIGYIYQNKADYKTALKNYLLAMSIREKINDKAGRVSSENNTGLLFYLQGNNKEALNHYSKAKKILMEIISKDSSNVDYKDRLASIHNNLGMIFSDENKENEALNNYFEALKLTKEIDNKTKMSEILNNIGNIFNRKEDYEQALIYYSKSLKISEKTDDKKSTVISLENMGNALMEKKDYHGAMKCFNQSLSLAQQIGNKKTIMEVYDNLADLNHLLGNKSAYDYCRMYSDLKDSILGEESTNAIAEMQTRFDTDKKDKENKLLNQEKEIQQAQIGKQKLIIYASFIVGLIIVLSSLFVFRAFKKEQKAKQLIAEQKEELDKTYHQLQEKSKEITDSIIYASRIQRALLTQEKYIEKQLNRLNKKES